MCIAVIVSRTHVRSSDSHNISRPGLTRIRRGAPSLRPFIVATGPSTEVSVCSFARALFETKEMLLVGYGYTADTETPGQGVLPSLSAGTRSNTSCLDLGGRQLPRGSVSSRDSALILNLHQRHGLNTGDLNSAQWR